MFNKLVRFSFCFVLFCFVCLFCCFCFVFVVVYLNRFCFENMNKNSLMDGLSQLSLSVQKHMAMSSFNGLTTHSCKFGSQFQLSG